MDDYKAFVERYKHLRPLGMRLNEKMIPMIGREMMHEGAQKLGIFKDGKIVLESEDELTVIMDFCLHNIIRDGQNVVQKYLAQSPPAEGSDELLLLTARLSGRYSMFNVKKVLPGVGVEMLDLFRQDQILVVDLGFSKTADVGMTLASRVSCFGDFWATGGAAMPVSPAALHKIQERLVKLIGTKEPDWNNLPAQLEADVVSTIIRTCLAYRDTARIKYEDVPGTRGPRSPMQPVRAPASVGRNEPCPCGSGKKYKKCCGG